MEMRKRSRYLSLLLHEKLIFPIALRPICIVVRNVNNHRHRIIYEAPIEKKTANPMMLDISMQYALCSPNKFQAAQGKISLRVNK